MALWFHRDTVGKLIAFHPHSATTKWQGFFFANTPSETIHWGILYPDAYSPGHKRYAYKVDVVDEMSQTLWNLKLFYPFYWRVAFFQCTEIELKPQCNNPAPSNSASNGDSFSGIAMAPERSARNRGRHKRMTKTSSNLVVPSVIHRFSFPLSWLKSFVRDCSSFQLVSHLTRLNGKLN